MRKAFTILPALLFYRMLFAQFSSDTVFTHPDLMPYFSGCEGFAQNIEEKRRCSDRELVRFISRFLVYPEIAKEAGVEGTVYVSFIVDENGAIIRPTVLMDIGGGCGEAALHLLEEMPKWEPGRQGNQPVKVRLNLPIQFSLKAPEPDLSEGYTLTWGNLHGEAATVEELIKSLESPVTVRDAWGNGRYVDELAFTFEKNKRLVNATSRGDISGELAKVVEKAKKGGVFTITASVQDKGRFIYVSRSFQVLD